MPSVTYTATRELSSGHSLDTEYSIDFDASDLDPDRKAIIKTTKSLGGNPSSVVQRTEKGWSVSTVPISFSDVDLWDEFLFSVSGKETFTFDPTGTAASPGNPQNVYLDTENWSYNRKGLGPNLMTVRFNVIRI